MQSDDAPLEAHLQKVADSPFHIANASGTRNVTPVLLRRNDDCPVPTRMMHLWEWYWAIARSRSSGMGGPEAITYAELHYWELRKGFRLSDAETQVMFDLDRIYRTPPDKKK